MEDRNTYRTHADITDRTARPPDESAAAPPAGTSLSPRDAIILERLRRHEDVLAAHDLRGRPVVDLSEGRRLGSVSDVMLDTSGERIVGFNLSLPGLFSGKGFLPFPQVHAIGEDAVTVEHVDHLAPSIDPEAARGAVSLRGLSGKRAFTAGGDKIGTVEDVVLDRPEGRIAAYAVEAPGFFGPRAYLLWTRGLTVGEDVMVIPEEAVPFLIGDRGGVRETWQEWISTLMGGSTVEEERNTAGNPEDDERLDNEFQYVIGHIAHRDVVVDGRVVVPMNKEVTAADAAAALAAGALEDLAFAVGAGNPSKIYVHGMPSDVDEEGEPIQQPDETGPVMTGPMKESGEPVAGAGPGTMPGASGAPGDVVERRVYTPDQSPEARTDETPPGTI